jgi:hypothetical protein
VRKKCQTDLKKNFCCFFFADVKIVIEFYLEKYTPAAVQAHGRVGFGIVSTVYVSLAEVAVRVESLQKILTCM